MNSGLVAVGAGAGEGQPARGRPKCARKASSTTRDIGKPACFAKVTSAVCASRVTVTPKQGEGRFLMMAKHCQFTAWGVQNIRTLFASSVLISCPQVLTGAYSQV